MSRNTNKITLNKGRDEGKVLVLTEMSAWNSNRWAIKMGRQLAKSGANLPAEVTDLGIAGVLTVIQEEGDMINSPTFFKSLLSIAANVDEDNLFSLLDELLTCVMFQTPEGHEVQFDSEQLEESASFNTVYSAVFQLHNFF